MNKLNEVCCPRFEPSAWDEKSFEWDGKKFVKDRVYTLFYMPINYGAVVKHITEKVTKAGADMSEWLFLSEHISKWRMDLYVGVDKSVPDAENTTLSGKYISKVYEGDFKNTGIWMKDFENYATHKGMRIKKTYMWYTTCPKCAQKYGKNYTVIVGQTN